jgi:uncharacterized membrane protein YgaE (UPF0421/DUF939 family)
VQDTPLWGDKIKRKVKKMKKEKKKEKRETEIKIRLTDKEKDELRTLAKEEGLSVSEYIRKHTLKKQAERELKMEMERQLIYELNRIGNNLNQMARGINILRKKGVLDDRDKKNLEVIKGIVEKVSKELEGVLTNAFKHRISKN